MTKFNARARKIIFTVLLAVLIAATVFAAVTTFAAESDGAVLESAHNFNADGSYEGGANAATGSAVTSGNIVNVVIFIAFSDTSDFNVGTSTLKIFNGENVSLEDYYDKVTEGNLSVNNIFASTGEGDGIAYCFYRAPKERAYYNVLSQSSTERVTKESELLNGAVTYADQYMDYDGLNLDADANNYVDAVSFIVAGSSGTSWGGLLWPHSWQLDAIVSKNASPSRAAAKLNNLKVNDYTFNFRDDLTVGLLCHEFGHVLGLPDLYHYNNDTSYYPVGKWDLMHLQGNTPQYPTTYVRYRYLNSVTDDDIISVSKTGTFTLKPVTQRSEGDKVACKIILPGSKETVWVEYRSNKGKYTSGSSILGGYDSDLPGSGLLIYRVNPKADGKGNVDGRHNSAAYPDELYVYRPNVSDKSTLKEREAENLSYAYLSSNNPYFLSLGNTESTTVKYNSQQIYTSDGANTGVVISLVSESASAVSFRITVPSSADFVIDSIKTEDDDVTVSYGDDPRSNNSLLIKYVNGSDYVYSGITDYTISGYDPELLDQKQLVAVFYRDDYNTAKTCNIYITVVDKFVKAELLSGPTKREYGIFESLDLTGLLIEVTYAKGGRQNVYKDDTRLSVTGFDSSKRGEKEIVATYRDEKLSVVADVSFIVTVVSAVREILFSAKDSHTVVLYGSSPVLSVYASYDDGTSEKLSSSDFTVSGFNASVTDTKQYVTLTYNKKSGLTVQNVAVYVIGEGKTVTAVSLSSLPDKTVYRYGEALDLTGGILQYIVDGEGGPTESLAAYYSAFSYNPQKDGIQHLSATVMGKSIAVDVSVDNKREDLLASSDGSITVDVRTYNVYLSEAMTLQDFSEKVTSYLNVSYYRGDEEISVNGGGQTYVSGMSVILSNGVSPATIKLTVTLKGDADNNGVLNGDDVTKMAELLLNNEGRDKKALDLDGDGYFTLNDLVKWAEKLCR